MAHHFILDVYDSPNRKYVNLSIIYYIVDFSFFLSQDDAYFHIHQNDPGNRTRVYRCTMEDEGTDNSASAGTEDGCNLLCTSLGANSNEISYLVWGERVSSNLILVQS